MTEWSQNTVYTYVQSAGGADLKCFVITATYLFAHKPNCIFDGFQLPLPPFPPKKTFIYAWQNVLLLIIVKFLKNLFCPLYCVFIDF